MTTKPWVNVAVFENIADGRLFEKYLQGRRLDARTYNDKLLQYFLFLCPPRATYRVQVRANAFQAATELINTELRARVLVQQAIHCPSCDSLEVQYPQMTRKFFLPTVLLNLGIIFRVIHHEAYCGKCHFLWNLPQPEKQNLHQAKAPGH